MHVPHYAFYQYPDLHEWYLGAVVESVGPSKSRTP